MKKQLLICLAVLLIVAEVTAIPHQTAYVKGKSLSSPAINLIATHVQDQNRVQKGLVTDPSKLNVNNQDKPSKKLVQNKLWPAPATVNTSANNSSIADPQYASNPSTHVTGWPAAPLTSANTVVSQQNNNTVVSNNSSIAQAQSDYVASANQVSSNNTFVANNSSIAYNNAQTTTAPQYVPLSTPYQFVNSNNDTVHTGLPRPSSYTNNSNANSSPAFFSNDDTVNTVVSNSVPTGNSYNTNGQTINNDYYPASAYAQSPIAYNSIVDNNDDNNYNSVTSVQNSSNVYYPSIVQNTNAQPSGTINQDQSASTVYYPSIVQNTNAQPSVTINQDQSASNVYYPSIVQNTNGQPSVTISQGQSVQQYSSIDQGVPSATYYSANGQTLTIASYHYPTYSQASVVYTTPAYYAPASN